MGKIHIDLKSEILESHSNSNIKEIALEMLKYLNEGDMSEERIRDVIKRRVDDIAREDYR